MHIAFLTPEYPGTNTGHSGGLGTSIKNLAEALVQHHIQVSVFVYGQQVDEVYTEAGIRFYRIQNIIIKGLSWWFTRKKVERIINHAIAHTGIEVLEVADWTGISAWMNINCKVVMRLHGSDTYFCHLDSRPVKRWNKFQEKIAFRQADAIIAVSDFVGKKTNEVFEMKRSYHVIPNGIDHLNFETSTSDIQEQVILYFGTLIRKKGVLDIPLIFNKVIEHLPEAKLLIVGGDSSDIQTGSSSTWELMKGLFSDKSRPQVSYLGRKPHEEIKQYIESAAVCIFPSYAEALPISWLEAMEMGKAIVASDIGWAKEMLEHNKEAYLINPKNHEIFANAIIDFLNYKEKRKLFGEAAQEKVEAIFSSSKIVDRNIKFFQSIITRN